MHTARRGRGPLSILQLIRHDIVIVNALHALDRQTDRQTDRHTVWNKRSDAQHSAAQRSTRSHVFTSSMCLHCNHVGLFRRSFAVPLLSFVELFLCSLSSVFFPVCKHSAHAAFG